MANSQTLSNLEILLRLRDQASSQLRKVANGVNSSMKSMAGGIADASKQAFKFTAVGVGALTAGLALAGKQALTTAQNFEQWEIAFKTMLGDSDKAMALLDDIKTFAKDTPFELTELVQGSKRLLAYNLEAEKIIPTMKALGDISAGLGKEKMPQLITAFGQIKAKGRLMGQELLQLREAGFDLANAMGITNEKLEELVADKAIKFADVEEAFISASSEGGRFFNLMEEQSASLGGILSNITDSFTILGLEIVRQTGIFDTFKGVADNIKVALEQNKDAIIGFFVGLVDRLKAFGEFVVQYKDIILPFLAGLAVAFGALTVIGGVITLVSALANPLVLITLLAGLLAAAWANNWGNIREKTANVVVWFRDKVLPTLIRVFAVIVNAQTEMVSFMMKAFDALIQFLVPLLGGMAKLFAKTFNGIAQVILINIQKPIDFIASALGVLSKLMVGDLKSILQSAAFNFVEWAITVTNVFSNLWDTIKNFFNKIAERVNSFFANKGVQEATGIEADKIEFDDSALETQSTFFQRASASLGSASESMASLSSRIDEMRGSLESQTQSIIGSIDTVSSFATGLGITDKANVLNAFGDNFAQNAFDKAKGLEDDAFFRDAGGVKGNDVVVNAIINNPVDVDNLISKLSFELNYGN